MSMPRDLVLVRHGQSDGNVASQAARDGDLRFYTDAFITTPGHRWRLTPTGTAQAAAIGQWLREQFPARTDAPSGFDRLMVSPYVRTRETAADLDLPSAQWMRNRALRERDWGDIGSLPREQFESDPRYRDNARLQRIDPLYWVAPGGESIAQVAEDRVRNVLDTLHRENSDQQVLCVTHGEFMWATRLVLERWDDEQFNAYDSDPAYRIENGTALHYTRVCPDTSELAPGLGWLRTATPTLIERAWSVQVSAWQAIGRELETNDDLRVAP